MLLWPHVRITLFRMIMADLLFGTLTSGRNSAIPFKRKLQTLTRSAARNTLLHLTRQNRGDVCIVSDGIANQLIDGKWINRLSDYFSKPGLPLTLTLEDQFEWKWPHPRYNERVVYLAPQRAYGAVTGRLRVRKQHHALAQEFVEFLQARALKCVGWNLPPAQFNYLTHDLARKLASFSQQYRAYRRMLMRIGPRLLMIGSASFGGLYSTLIAAARSLDIVTAEYQHGAVSLGHDAYNFSDTLRASPEFERILPDYFLGYGKWWIEQINIPVNKIAIGNPHREARLAQTDLTKRKDIALILSDGSEFDMYVSLAVAIEPAARKRGLQVVIRPHPLERSVVEARQRGMEPVRIDKSPDIFSSLARASIVVSEVSTVMFDAIGLADQIYMWDTPKARFAYPNHPFRCFSSPGELAHLIEEPSPGQAISSEQFWAPHWLDNYNAFLSRLGIGNPTA